MKGIYIGLVAGLAAVLLLAAGAAIIGPAGGEVVSGNGTVIFVDLEGGFYGIVADDGTHYHPTNLPDEFKVDNLSVSFTAAPQASTGSIQMWGIPVEISAIDAIPADTSIPDLETISDNGTVRFIDLEGGFFGIVGDDGEEYYPMNLDDEFQVNELRVHIEAQLQKDTMTIQMWGTPILITRIEAIDTNCTSCK
jgi:hypothetical protein